MPDDSKDKSPPSLELLRLLAKEQVDLALSEQELKSLHTSLQALWTDVRPLDAVKTENVDPATRFSLGDWTA